MVVRSAASASDSVSGKLVLSLLGFRSTCSCSPRTASAGSHHTPGHRKTNRRAVLALKNCYSCHDSLIGEETSFHMWLLAECHATDNSRQGVVIYKNSLPLACPESELPYASIARPAIPFTAATAYARD
ncbi:hypothetical protein CORC01_05916 [Colletotrichum orchidophilum]|uniref:Uncharacterized protein n=1 Tax=Colletotrichum orchidophilum TaxID=1209926 RepID=A0A1G4BBN7_9PEZI|nr:uncharacterized protein CORC01_05916 [Colletotrichum orchidophilum]OHE98827.1 hypothetical protein CORC01_05916 [Colletotrichum orchidophilum]